MSKRNKTKKKFKALQKKIKLYEAILRAVAIVNEAVEQRKKMQSVTSKFAEGGIVMKNDVTYPLNPGEPIISRSTLEKIRNFKI